MLLREAMLEVGLEIEPEVDCVGGCRGCMVAVPEGVQRVCVRRVCGGCAEGVQRVCVQRVCGGCAEGVQRMYVWRLCGGCVCGGCAEGVQRCR